MGALSEFSDAAIHYWERRRLIFNALLVPPAWIGWELSRQFTNAIDDRIPARFDDPLVIRSGFTLLVFANVCYSLVYLLEVALIADQPRNWWRRSGRLIVFLVGCMIAMAGTLNTAFHVQTSARGGFLPTKERTEQVAPAQRP